MQHKLDVVLVDLQLCNGNCVEHIPKLLSISQMKVLAFSHNHSEQIYLRTFRSGVVGIISKNCSSELLLKAIYAIHAGQVCFDRRVTKLVWQAQFDVATSSEIQTDVKTMQLHKLSENERQVAYFACKGLSAKEINLLLSVTKKNYT